MITDAFDNSEVLFGTKDFYGEQKHLCDKCMVVFSEQIFEYMLDTYEHQEVGVIRCCNGITPVYVFDIEGMKIAGYLSHIGSALAGGDVIDVNWLTGAVKFIMFGSAGSLDSGLTTGKFVIPTHSYREEGLSYHYAPPADYIEVKNAKIVKAIFDKLKLPNVLGKVWTTDAIYRETKAKFDARKKEGCIAVEMELAGVQAVCDFYGWELYNFLVTGDALSCVADGEISCIAECNPLHGPWIEEIIQMMEQGRVPSKYTYVDEGMYSNEDIASSITINGSSYLIRKVNPELLVEHENMQ